MTCCHIPTPPVQVYDNVIKTEIKEMDILESHKILSGGQELWIEFRTNKSDTDMVKKKARFLLKNLII